MARNPSADVRATIETLSALAIRELDRQDGKWGIQDHNPVFWWLILSEEIGELAKSVLESDPTEAVIEAAQVVALIGRLLERMLRAPEGGRD